MGGKNLGQKYILRQHCKKFKKIPFYSKKFLRTIFLVIDNFFQKFTSFIQNLLPFLCMFLSLSLFLISFIFIFLNEKKIKNLVCLLGGKKWVLPPS